MDEINLHDKLAILDRRFVALAGHTRSSLAARPSR
jgi:hypothetical protein